MNANLFAIIKQIVAEQGESILSEPRRVSAFFADLAKDEPKPQKNAFIKCLEQGFAQTLKNAPEQDRALCKQRLSQRLNAEEGLDPRLCGEAIELLTAVLFGEEQKKKEHICKNCGKELQEGWKTCPYCTTVVAETANTSQVISSAISSRSGSRGYGVEQINSATPTSSNKIVDITRRCFGCRYKTIDR
ncbi:MAG: zinc ribbon domain-containing protein, partial [Treponema sp.]|nr:zinc ribbon domain-containing protein [Treponema sp.]